MNKIIDTKLAGMFQGEIMEALQLTADIVAVRLRYGNTFSVATVGPDNKRRFFHDCSLTQFKKRYISK